MWDTHFFSIFHNIAHISWISAYKKNFGSRRHFHFKHEYFCDSFATKVSKILHICIKIVEIYDIEKNIKKFLFTDILFNPVLPPHKRHGIVGI